ncbi:MAG TPA: preprotein translocase subunit SecY [Candidatus Polarisedimenticolia bacterium]|nr:preprotein translocase subunit SecY [Candidatus Polarisedimenticolia bacterium]
MLDGFSNASRIPELRKRLGFTAAALAIYRLGVAIPTPGIDGQALAQFFAQARNNIVGLVNLFSGGALERFSIFALGIMPYISASIILQLLTVVVPYLEKLSKEGELGRRKITQYTRYGTVVLSVVQSLGIAFWLENLTGGGGSGGVVPHPGWGFRMMTVLTLTTGTAFIMWVGEQISERGIGNGISLIIYAGIVSGLPSAVATLWQDVTTGTLGPIAVVVLLFMMTGVIAAIIWVERAQRKIPVQYARRVVGRRMYGGMQTHMPLRLNTGGVIPVIFASSVLAFPLTFMQWLGVQDKPWLAEIYRQLDYSMPLHNLLYLVAIVFFCYFYISIIFNPMDVADNMKKYGGFIPGIRPGRRTAEYLDTILTRLTFVGAIYLGLIALLPQILISGMKVQALPVVGPALDQILPSFLTQGLGLKFYFGGTSLLIVVGVAMDTVQQVESQLIMRHYDGFLKGARIRGRRG